METERHPEKSNSSFLSQTACGKWCRIRGESFEALMQSYGVSQEDSLWA